MFEYLYEWIQNVSFYLVLVTAAVQVVPNKDYKRYIQFFTGLVLVLMMISPILSIFGAKNLFTEIYNRDEYEEQIQKFEWMQEEIVQPETDGEHQNIEVGEIKIE